MAGSNETSYSIELVFYPCPHMVTDSTASYVLPKPDTVTLPIDFKGHIPKLEAIGQVLLLNARVCMNCKKLNVPSYTLVPLDTNTP